MTCLEEKKETGLFKEIQDSEKRQYLDLDLDAHYERAFSELGLQQTKRDQLITLYLAMFSFLIPFALSMEGVSLQIKGLIFLVAAVVGILFALIIIRYRIYKEVYWLCCQCLTVLHNIQPEKLNKEMVQRVYYHSLKKKGKSFMVERKQTEGDKQVVKRYFSNAKYVEKNLFSSESIYFFIHCLLTVLIFGLSIGLILPGNVIARVAVSVLLGTFLFFLLSAKYFSECVKVYGVMADDSDEVFNATFSKAWFLHFDV